MRPLLPALLMTTLYAGGARAEFSLFGSAERTPANPFASNYASPPARGADERPRRLRRPPQKPEALRPPRDISR
jgi:hypothetical protein